jgi:hypothetical protein
LDPYEGTAGIPCERMSISVILNKCSLPMQPLLRKDVASLQIVLVMNFLSGNLKAVFLGSGYP